MIMFMKPAALRTVMTQWILTAAPKALLMYDKFVDLVGSHLESLFFSATPSKEDR